MDWRKDFDMAPPLHQAPFVLLAVARIVAKPEVVDHKDHNSRTENSDWIQLTKWDAYACLLVLDHCTCGNFLPARSSFGVLAQADRGHLLALGI